MVKKVENVESCCGESCNCGNGCCGGKVLITLLALLWAIAAIIACFFSYKAFQNARNSYNLNVLSAGWEENLQKMNELYSNEAYIKYATEQTDWYINSFLSAYGDTTEEDNSVDNGSDESSDNAETSYLDSLKGIAVEFGTDEDALQTCIDEWRYVQAVKNMWDQWAEVFWVSWTPGNVIVDRENGNYIVLPGAYPAEDFVNAISEYKNGAENFVAWGDEIKAIVEEMLKSAPVRGNKDAKFTIIEYTELLCPYCQRHSQAGTINTIIEQFSGEVNSVSRHFIIHGDEALQLAAAMECVAELNPEAYYETFEEAFKWL